MKKDKEENSIHDDLTASSEQCLTFTSHELFWKELETIVEEGAEASEE